MSHNVILKTCFLNKVCIYNRLYKYNQFKSISKVLSKIILELLTWFIVSHVLVIVLALELLLSICCCKQKIHACLCVFK